MGSRLYAYERLSNQEGRLIMEASYYIDVENYQNLKIGERVLVTKADLPFEQLWNLKIGQIGKVVALQENTCQVFNPIWNEKLPRVMCYDEIQRLK